MVEHDHDHSMMIHVDHETGTTNLSEADIAKFRSSVSAGPWENVFEAFRMPEELRGLRILDLGAGASDTTDKLLELGVDAYAIDPQYKNKSELRGQVRRNFATSNLSKEAIQQRARALERFTDSAKAHPDRYRTAYATELPFPDNFFDLAFSLNAVSVYLNSDRNILTKAMDEVLRILKCRGTLQMFPFDENFGFEPEIEQLRIANDRYLVDWLSSHSLVETVSVEPLDASVENSRERLVVVKA